MDTMNKNHVLKNLPQKSYTDSRDYMTQGGGGCCCCCCFETTGK